MQGAAAEVWATAVWAGAADCPGGVSFTGVVAETTGCSTVAVAMGCSGCGAAAGVCAIGAGTAGAGC